MIRIPIDTSKPNEHASNVVLLSRRKEEKQTVPMVEVERITEDCRWQVEPGAKCRLKHFGVPCPFKAKYVLHPVGNKYATLSCHNCLDSFLAYLLPRPAEEVKEIEQREIRRHQENAARKKHDADGLCDGRTGRTAIGLCDRKPVAFCPCRHPGGSRFCQFHDVRHRSHRGYKRFSAAMV